MVEVGFTPPDVTNTLPSTMKRFFTSCERPHSLTTERSGSVPMRAVPSRCQPPHGIGELTQMSLAPAVLADRVVDLWRGNAVAVLQYRIQRDPIMLLRQVLANRRKPEPMTVEL